MSSARRDGQSDAGAEQAGCRCRECPLRGDRSKRQIIGVVQHDVVAIGDCDHTCEVVSAFAQCEVVCCTQVKCGGSARCGPGDNCGGCRLGDVACRCQNQRIGGRDVPQRDPVGFVQIDRTARRRGGDDGIDVGVEIDPGRRRCDEIGSRHVVRATVAIGDGPVGCGQSQNSPGCRDGCDVEIAGVGNQRQIAVGDGVGDGNSSGRLHEDIAVVAADVLNRQSTGVTNEYLAGGGCARDKRTDRNVERSVGRIGIVADCAACRQRQRSRRGDVGNRIVGVFINRAGAG